MQKMILIMITLLLLTGCVSGEEAPETVETTAAVTEAVIAETEATAAETVPVEERFVLTFVGDCTFGSNPVNYYAGYGFIKTVGEDYTYPFRNVLQYFEGDECTLINLEGPLCDGGNPVQKKHTFRGPTDYVNILSRNCVEAVTIANNHTMDYGEKGYISTVETLENAGIPYVQRDESLVFTTEHGITLGIYGAVYYALDKETITAEIAALRQCCDLVIFAPHWGTEGTYRPTEQQVELGHAAIDAGADIVWGSHPHVLQPVEPYNGGVIFYSLGNFSFGGNGYPGDMDTVLVQQVIIRDEDGVRLGETVLIPASVSSIPERNNYQPTPYDPDSGEYARTLSKLDGTFAGPNLKIN